MIMFGHFQALADYSGIKVYQLVVTRVKLVFPELRLWYFSDIWLPW